VRIGPDEGIRVDDRLVRAGVLEDDGREVLEVHLVDDAGARGYDAEVGERLLAPAQELVALEIALELALDVELEGVGQAVGIDLDRVVDDEVDGLKRVDALWVAAERLQGFAHGCEVDDYGHAGEVLEEDPGRSEADLAVHARIWLPIGERFDVLDGYAATVLIAEEVLEQDTERERQAGGGGQHVEAEVGK
jgi:hypothetical protein